MFCLPSIANLSPLPVFPSSLVSIITALLAESLDDRLDQLQDALQRDPVLAIWSVHAAESNRVRLDSLPLAARWLEQNFLNRVAVEQITQVKQRSHRHTQTWQSVVATSIRTARHAHQRQQGTTASKLQAYWFAQLCSCHRQLASWAQQNGHAPIANLHGYQSAWLDELYQRVEGSDRKQAVCFAARRALEETASTDQAWMDDGELSELFRPCRATDRLLQSLLKRMQSWQQLELHFAERLQTEKMAAMQQLAYGASHEINNPLANIATRAQTLMHDEPDATRRQKLMAINQQAYRAYEMIADLMLFAKPPELQRDSVDLSQLLLRIRTELEATWKQASVEVVSPSVSPFIEADEAQLGVAIQAICLNGIEAMAGEGTLRVELVATDSLIQIIIQDSGSGLNEQARRHLFDPFFSGREAGRGLGFGLSKAWRIIQQHHGRITVDSSPTRGSCFVVTLPTDHTDAQN